MQIVFTKHYLQGQHLNVKFNNKHFFCREIVTYCICVKIIFGRLVLGRPTWLRVEYRLEGKLFVSLCSPDDLRLRACVSPCPPSAEITSTHLYPESHMAWYGLRVESDDIHYPLPPMGLLARIPYTSDWYYIHLSFLVLKGEKNLRTRHQWIIWLVRSLFGITADRQSDPTGPLLGFLYGGADPWWPNLLRETLAPNITLGLIFQHELQLNAHIQMVMQDDVSAVEIEIWSPQYSKS